MLSFSIPQKMRLKFASRKCHTFVCPVAWLTIFVSDLTLVVSGPPSAPRALGAEGSVAPGFGSSMWNDSSRSAGIKQNIHKVTTTRGSDLEAPDGPHNTTRRFFGQATKGDVVRSQNLVITRLQTLVGGRQPLV